jgi:hypothetical protein
VLKKKLHLVLKTSAKNLLVKKKRNVRMELARKKRKSLAVLLRITAKRNLNFKPDKQGSLE